MSNARELAELGGSYGTGGFVGMKNRIINGAMVIDQRNAGAAVTNTATPIYTLDRWSIHATASSKFTAQQSSVAPSGFSKSILITSSAATSLGASDFYLLRQPIEGFNTADFGFGAAGAATVTLSFWVRSSLTGSFSAALYNDAGNRCYPFSYTISSANTWEQKTITIAGDTSGTWVGATNGIGLYVNFNLGVGTTYSGTANTWGSAFAVTGATSVVGTNGATFYITGVQLEKGSTATSFDFRDYGREFYMCQRYFQSLAYAASQLMSTGISYSTTAAAAGIYFPQEMRATPSITLPAAGQSTGQISFLNGSSYPAATGSHAILNANSRGFRIEGTGYTGLGGVGTTAWLYPSGNVKILASAEL